MKNFDFVIGYDIASPKRLQKIAKLLEKVAIRIQYSLFFYPKVSREMLENLTHDILELMDENEDDVRIYRVDSKRSLCLMSGFDLIYPKLFIGVDNDAK
jgi:CRISPR-associated protein Cas2